MSGTAASRARGPVVRRDFQRFAAAVGDRNPLYFDPDYARAHGYRDVIAPPLYLPIAVQGVVDLDTLRPDGLPGTGAGTVPLPRTPRLLAGGDAWEFFEPAYDGDLVTAVRVIGSIESKHGRSGPFLVVSGQTTYRREDETVLAICTDTVLARP